VTAIAERESGEGFFVSSLVKPFFYSIFIFVARRSRKSLI
jgi:hypothetical protein